VRTFVRAATAAGAKTLDAIWYKSSDVFEQEQERVFSRSWVAAGREEQVANPGDYFLLGLAGESLIITRDAPGRLHAFYNVCRHRAGPVAEGCGSRKVFRCGYHGWTYSLEGKLLNAPEMEGTKDFSAEELRLRPVQVDEWEGQVFVNLDAEAEALLTALGELPGQAEKYKFGSMRLAGRRECTRIDSKPNRLSSSRTFQ